MLEQFDSYKSNGQLEIIKQVKNPSIFNYKEWKAEISGKFSAGFIVGVVIDGDEPDKARVYFDGGRRRTLPNQPDAIVLEGIEISTKEVIKNNFKLGDVVQIRSSLLERNLHKLASIDSLEELRVAVYPLSFDWDRVIGAAF